MLHIRFGGTVPENHDHHHCHHMGYMELGSILCQVIIPSLSPSFCFSCFLFRPSQFVLLDQFDRCFLAAD